jgi:hypothetical protein
MITICLVIQFWVIVNREVPVELTISKLDIKKIDPICVYYES